MSDLLNHNWSTLIERFFNDSSLSVDEAPKLVVLYGSIASGKSTVRRLQYASGFVVLDAGEIFLALGYRAGDNFPPHDPTLLNLAGRTIVRRAMLERRHLVIELVSNFAEQLDEVLSAAQQLGCSVNLIVLDCSADEAIRRNDMRATDDISSYYAQKFHVNWLLEVVTNPPRYSNMARP